MFSWFGKRKVDPPKLASRAPDPPAKDAGDETPEGGMEAVRGRIGFANGQENWEEEFDVVQTTTRALHDRGHEVTVCGDTLEHASGLTLRPVMVIPSLPPVSGTFSAMTSPAMTFRIRFISWKSILPFSSISYWVFSLLISIL